MSLEKPTSGTRRKTVFRGKQMPVYLTSTDVEAKIEELKTGEISEDVEYVGYPHTYTGSPRDFYGMFPEQLCEHGIRRELCYPCTPLSKGVVK